MDVQYWAFLTSGLPALERLPSVVFLSSIAIAEEEAKVDWRLWDADFAGKRLR
ncbi:MAG: hypothetical protein ABR913_06210 [Sedimentisphaerales bacterium]